MSLESFNYIDSLNTANPTTTDNVSEGDDHIRGIKTTLKNTFPNINAAVTATDEELNYVDGVTSSIQTQIDSKEATGVALPLAGGTLTGNLNLGDNVKAQFGAGNDLQIYHDGSHSFVQDSGEGNLYIRASNSLYLNNADNTAVYASFANGGGAGLYHNNSAKLATTSTGIDVTGNVTCDGATIGATVTAGQTGSGNYVLRKNGTLYAYNTVSGAGNVYLETYNGAGYSIKTNSSERLLITNDGNVGIGTSSPATLLSLGSGVDAQKLALYDAGNTFKYGFGIQTDELRTYCPNSGHMSFGTISTSDGTTWSEKARIDSDGLKFNGDTAAANALDDYEEGTWTPVPARISTPISTTGTITASGTYTKIGRQVYCCGVITITGTITQGPNICTALGLPFTPATDASNRQANQVTWDKEGQTALTGLNISQIGVYTDYLYSSVTFGANGPVWAAGEVNFSYSYRTS